MEVKTFLYALVLLSLTSCSQVKVLSKYELTDGRYYFHQKGEHYRKVDVEMLEDSVVIVHNNQIHRPAPLRDQYFFQTNIDIDLLYTVFKYRPAQPSLPRQLTNSFNTNLFLGYRLDRYHFKYSKSITKHISRAVRHRSISLGAFGGIGSSTIAPWTTNYQITDEYSGLTLSRGIMVIAGVDSMNFGFAFGLDRLTDRDKDIWIYQNKPWYGITIGLSIN